MHDRTPAPAASKLMAFRKKLGISQQKAAEALGCSGPTFNDWEHGKKRPEPKFMARIEAWTSGEVSLPDWILPSEECEVEPAAVPDGEPGAAA